MILLTLMERIQNNIKCEWPKIAGFSREEQEEMIINFQIEEVYPQLLEILALKNKFLEAFPMDKFRITFMNGVKIDEVIEMYNKANKTASKSTIIKTAMRTNFVKTVDSIITKLLSGNKSIDKLKDHLRFTVEIIDDLQNPEQLAQYALKVFEILPEHYILCQDQPIEGLYNEVTGFSEATFQPINSKNSRKIEIKFNTSAGLEAKAKEHPTFKERKKLTGEIFNLIGELTDFDKFWDEINDFTKDWIESGEDIIPKQKIQELSQKLGINQIHQNLIVYFYKYKKLLLKSRAVLSESHGVISSKDDAKEFEKIFMSLDPVEAKNKIKSAEKTESQRDLLESAINLRDKLNSMRL
jgi:hypothetical protein